MTAKDEQQQQRQEQKQIPRRDESQKSKDHSRRDACVWVKGCIAFAAKRST
jgi:hypothetical protein